MAAPCTQQQQGHGSQHQQGDTEPSRLHDPKECAFRVGAKHQLTPSHTFVERCLAIPVQHSQCSSSKVVQCKLTTVTPLPVPLHTAPPRLTLNTPRTS
jgi:hypothetical protein